MEEERDKESERERDVVIAVREGVDPTEFSSVQINSKPSGKQAKSERLWWVCLRLV